MLLWHQYDVVSLNIYLNALIMYSPKVFPFTFIAKLNILIWAFRSTFFYNFGYFRGTLFSLLEWLFFMLVIPIALVNDIGNPFLDYHFLVGTSWFTFVKLGCLWAPTTSNATILGVIVVILTHPTPIGFVTIRIQCRVKCGCNYIISNLFLIWFDWWIGLLPNPT
jgi:hypothetical protein